MEKKAIRHPHEKLCPDKKLIDPYPQGISLRPGLPVTPHKKSISRYWIHPLSKSHHPKNTASKVPG